MAWSSSLEPVRPEAPEERADHDDQGCTIQYVTGIQIYIHIIIRIIHNYTRGPEVYILYNLSAALPPAQGAYRQAGV